MTFLWEKRFTSQEEQIPKTIAVMTSTVLWTQRALERNSKFTSWVCGRKRTRKKEKTRERNEWLVFSLSLSLHYSPLFESIERERDSKLLNYKTARDFPKCLKSFPRNNLKHHQQQSALQGLWLKLKFLKSKNSWNHCRDHHHHHYMFSASRNLKKLLSSVFKSCNMSTLRALRTLRSQNSKQTSSWKDEVAFHFASKFFTHEVKEEMRQKRWLKLHSLKEVQTKWCVIWAWNSWLQHRIQK